MSQFLKITKDSVQNTFFIYKPTNPKLNVHQPLPYYILKHQNNIFCALNQHRVRYQETKDHLYASQSTRIIQTIHSKLFILFFLFFPIETPIRALFLVFHTCLMPHDQIWASLWPRLAHGDLNFFPDLILISSCGHTNFPLHI